jgi:hypothetical protein
MTGYEEAESDLYFLAGLSGEGSALVLPVQFDTGARNHAQMLVNDLGVSLTVCLGDTVLLDYLAPEVMPLTVLIRSEGEVRATGFGSPERLLTGTGEEN